MKLLWHEEAWEDYLWWHAHDKRMVARIHALLSDVQRNGYAGLGKPEPLKANLRGWWSRRIDCEHRLVYRLAGDVCQIIQCKGHYGSQN
ncbi:Txe/YoeB family addiction module toxin [Desulfovibrio legallii]|jgi:toxin YoeB|uniref:Putative mRNA interferase YoeB n=1 Tax=Desulfovibrio legallii TaxID=571438 RepID=A0A1G7IMU8_9BACT|nr:Txe/YoeB family addiction module toxin [Desulfovibrio legallii]SDF14057.1 toxin YoeB [Desulfovibrio legallii]